MRTIKGPGLFLAQFATDTPPHNTLPNIARWAKDYGYKAIQIPAWDKRLFDIDKAYDSEAYCDEIKGMLADIGIVDQRIGHPFARRPCLVTPRLRPDARWTSSC